MLAQRLLDGIHIHANQLRNHADINHVLDQLAQLGLRTDCRHYLVKRHRIELDILTQFVELERFVIDGRSACGQRKHVFFRRLGVHCNQEIDLLLASDISVLARADRVPGWESSDIRWKKILARDRDPHAK